MLRRATLRSIHLFGTVWFMLCLGYILVLALRQAGVQWWIVFSLSGHGAFDLQRRQQQSERSN